MFLLTAPARLPDSPRKDVPIVYLAGGLATPWREEVIFRLEHNTVILVDPTNKGLAGGLNATQQQTQWERTYLDRADAIMFWFPSETPCPVALFELGFLLAQGKKVFIGAHPLYPKLNDLIAQVRVIDDRIIVDTDLEFTIERLWRWVSMQTGGTLETKRQTSSQGIAP